MMGRVAAASCGGFPVYGQAVADTINETDPSLSIEPRNTKGSTENVPLLEAGRLELALVQGESAYEALNGIGRPRANLSPTEAVSCRDASRTPPSA